MLKCFDTLIGRISTDPLVVANKLVEAGLVPPKLVGTMLLPHRDNYDKAAELVLQVTNMVESTPEKFEVFISILSNFLWLDDLVESVYKQYEANKQTFQEVLLLKVWEEGVTMIIDKRETVIGTANHALMRRGTFCVHVY